MDKHYLQGQIKKVGEKMLFIASDETLDRSNEVVPMDSWDLKNYLKNPVLLVNHDYRVENIVGRARNLSTTGGKLTFEPEFHELTQLAAEVKAMVEAGVLNSVSVGFMPHMPNEDGGKVMNELLEISLVPVGANPNALRLNSLAKSVLSAEQKTAIENWLKKQNEIVELQRIEFAKAKFANTEQVKAWLNDNDYWTGDISETDEAFIVKYFDQGKCVEGTDISNETDEGVTFVACKVGERAVAGQKSMGSMSSMVDDMGDLQERMRANMDELMNESKSLDKASSLIDEMADLHSRMRSTMDDMMSNNGGKAIDITALEKLNAELVALKEGRVLSGKNRKAINNAVEVLKQATATLEELLQATDPSLEKDSADKGRKTIVVQGANLPKKAKLPVVRVLQAISRNSNDLLRDIK